jgi:hypothetical protein
MPGPSRPAVGQATRLPLRVITPFDADLVMVVTAVDLADTRAIARTLEVSEDPLGWRQRSERASPVSCLSSLDGDRDDVHGCRPW